ncbi:hypothetical protein [Streptomyces iconiensis]|uniref:Uncharacterized protein n=1 Tax=Streptomyces iconiensis TaxID=1384038 RepID=A0ABT7ABH7_9ACTN|nr:hypothetical protein [Streptomyces iconiensis]MDJ1137968.1 hypothetical protein [Streptomyces iconiensis]
MRLSKAVGRAAVVGIATLATFGVSTTTASAGVTQSIRTERAGAWFYHYGDVLVASDYKKDGIGARAILTWGGNKVVVTANGGVNDSEEKDLNIKEGTTVWLQLCYTGGSTSCSAVQKGIA